MSDQSGMRRALAARIRGARAALGLSQGELARRVGGGVSQQLVSDWEQGKRLGAVLKAVRLLRVLGQGGDGLLNAKQGRPPRFAKRGEFGNQGIRNLIS